MKRMFKEKNKQTDPIGMGWGLLKFPGPGVGSYEIIRKGSWQCGGLKSRVWKRNRLTANQ